MFFLYEEKTEPLKFQVLYFIYYNILEKINNN